MTESSAMYNGRDFSIITVEIVVRDVIAIISYEPFWKTLKRKDVTQYRLIKDYGFSTGTLDALRKNKSITLNTLHDICEMLDCGIADVVEFVRSDEKE